MTSDSVIKHAGKSAHLGSPRKGNGATPGGRDRDPAPEARLGDGREWLGRFSKISKKPSSPPSRSDKPDDVKLVYALLYRGTGALRLGDARVGRLKALIEGSKVDSAAIDVDEHPEAFDLPGVQRSVPRLQAYRGTTPVGAALLLSESTDIEEVWRTKGPGALAAPQEVRNPRQPDDATGAKTR